MCFSSNTHMHTHIYIYYYRRKDSIFPKESTRYLLVEQKIGKLSIDKLFTFYLSGSKSYFSLARTKENN